MDFNNDRFNPATVRFESNNPRSLPRMRGVSIPQRCDLNTLLEGHTVTDESFNPATVRFEYQSWALGSTHRFNPATVRFE